MFPATNIRGSSILSCVVERVIVLPKTLKFPCIATSLVKVTLPVIVPPLYMNELPTFADVNAEIIAKFCVASTPIVTFA